MVKWLQLTEIQRKAILNEVSARTSLPVNAIEKDWWVTLTLQACFQTSWKEKLVFKGGTSLSKAWGLIERFSEDIDLVLDREVLGFEGELSKNQIKKLRERTAEFIATAFKASLYSTLTAMGVDPELFKLTIKSGGTADRDPQILELHYHSVLETDGYVIDKVIIEIGTRSLMEPANDRTIYSIIGATLPGQPFSGTPFTLLTVNPKRTFLEKIFLLHEEFTKSAGSIRHERMSRHLYDLERLMDTQFGQEALQDVALYQLIVAHRAKYTPVRGLDYHGHSPQRVDIIPPEDVRGQWERDYGQMQESMIYGAALGFADLLARLEVLRERIRAKEVNLEFEG